MMNFIIKNLKLIIKNSCYAQAGFTLIETLTALSILSISVVALISMTSSGIANTNFSKNRLIASYLNTEAIEAVRNMKDSQNFADFKDTISPCMEDVGCAIDAATIAGSNSDWQIVKCSEDICGQLFFDNNFSGASSGGFYTLSFGEKSPFRRIIHIKDVGNGGNEVSVLSEVFWRQGTLQKSVSASENMFNWK